MGVEFDYTLSRTVSVAEILGIRDLIRHRFPGFLDFKSSDCFCGQFSVQRRLPPLEIPEGLAVWGASVSATLRKGVEPYEILPRLFAYAEQNPRCGLSVRCDFEEQAGSETRWRCNSISVGSVRNNKWLGYDAYGGRTCDDSLYLRGYFERLIDRLDLPMRLRDGRHGFVLEHTEGAKLSLSLGNGAGNHRSFRCYMPNASVESLLARMQTCVAEMRTGRIFKYRWFVGIADDHNNRLAGKEVYDWLAAENLPMQSGKVNLTVSLLDLGALDALKGLCGRNGKFYMMLFGFELGDGMLGRLDLCTRRDGHHLILVLPDPEELPRVQAVLNLPLLNDPTAG